MNSYLKKKIFRFLIVALVLFSVAYMMARLVYLFLFLHGTSLKLLGLIFFLAESFMILHSMGYMLQIYDVLGEELKGRDHQLPIKAPLKDYPPVAIIVASYKEPLSILEETLTCFYNLTYPNKRLYLLDDTRYDKPWDDPKVVEEYKRSIDALCRWTEVNVFRRKWHDAKAGIINDFLQYLREEPGEFICLNHQNINEKEKPKYIIVFDADMNPLPNFVEDLVTKMEENPTTAFIQTPQYYTNFASNRVAKAASLVQIVFYEYICEAKGLRDFMICCGTNVILRVDALNEVGGFDVSSVTEDFATSLKLHQKGWKSAYVNKVTAFGMGPEDLGAFFKQQFRWAIGTIGLLPKIIKAFFKKPSFLGFVEYFFSSTYYFIGWVILVLMLGPICYLFFDMNIYYMNPVIYGLIMVPYLILSSYLFYATLMHRNYSMKDLFLGTVLNLISFPVFMKASISGILGIKSSFVVTPKGQSESLPLKDLWPQVTVALLCLAATVWGLLRIFFEGEPLGGLIINTLWAFYYFAMLSTIVYYFNEPEKKRVFTFMPNLSND